MEDDAIYVGSDLGEMLAAIDAAEDAAEDEAGGIVDQALAIGGSFDWVTPALQFLAGSGWETVTCHEGWQPQIAQAIYDHGLRVKNGFFNGGQYCCQVHEDDAGILADLMGWDR